MNNKTVRFILNIYGVVVLIAAAVLSPPILSFVPVVLLLWDLYQWWRPVSTLAGFLTQFFLFFATGLFFSLPSGPYFALLISLPLLLAVDLRLRDIGSITRPGESKQKRAPTNFNIVILAITVTVLALGLITGTVELMLAAGVVIVYLLVIVLFILRRLASSPVTVEPVSLRVVAGAEGTADIVLTEKSGTNGTLFLDSPYDWVKITPAAFIPLTPGGVILKASVTPLLSGPAAIKVSGYVIDQWGLTQTRFEIEPLTLNVIPRARYADWLAKKYMSGTNMGQLPLISNIGSIKPLYGLRRGIEFYGIKMYQPGDSMKNIDWKHSVKYNDLVSKEFSEVQAQPAIILVNLVAHDEEEKDKLVYNVVVSALCLAQDGIPAALAAYNEKDIVETTHSLSAQNLVARALRIVKDIVIRPDYARYLAPPDIGRLRANINRLNRADSKPAAALLGLLQFEYKSLGLNSQSNPCTRSLNEVLAKTNRLSTLIVISCHNHDAEALAFNMHSLAGKGNTVVNV